jgi:hypothetical protein
MRTDDEIHQYRVELARKGKEFDPARNAWIRKTDCLIAERFFGYVWMKCNPKQDFSGATFHVVLSPGDEPLDAGYILEPDTRVQNYTTNLHFALDLARIIGLTSIPVLPTDKEMAAWICEKALTD